ncbi:MAG: hypothetical protein EOO11_21455, partial [Chitinophagaceae bacterium]
MKQYDWHSIDAFKVSLKCMNDHNRLWADNEHVAESVAYVDPLVQELLRRADKQGATQPEGLTAAKDLALDRMLALGFGICKKLKVYARKSGNLVLQRDTAFSKSTFDDGTEEEQAARCRRMADHAEANLARLASYKVTDTMIAALRAAITAFTPMETERDSVADQRKLLTASISTLMRRTRAKFRELDEEMDAFFDGEEYTDFYEAYFEARRVSRVKPRQPQP